MQNNGFEQSKPRGAFRGRRFRVIVILCAIVVAAAIGPALVCEAKTALHMKEFEDSQTEGFGEYRKVISYNLVEAKIYAWSNGSEDGEECLGGVLKLRWESDAWEIVGWEPYWSDGDGNDRVVWQYWWHFVYFLF